MLSASPISRRRKGTHSNPIMILTSFVKSCITAYAVLSIGSTSHSGLQLAYAKVACTETATCESALRPGSTCVDGYCTNPFVKGCLNRILGDEAYPKIRTCNSDDKPNAACAPSPLNYEEVRIAPNNWESAMFYAWVIQILLSEVLDVPSTIETNVGGGALSFYDEQNSFAYPKKANPFDALYKANEVGDCTKTDEPCAHFISEMWQGKRVLNESAVEREGNGMVGHVGWFVPKFVAESDASLTHYLGLKGPANRQKLADTFKRPLRWIDYCEQISTDNCTNKDDVASRAPKDATEAEKYFVRDEYIGHFVYTDKNNCTANPNSCTGHMIDYPCTWSAYTASQLYWNDISLESDTPDGSNSYTYSAMLQIIDAANATRSPILMTWWYPDPTPELYDYVKVSERKTSRECLENRPEAKPNRCNATREVLIGKEIGSCGYNTHTLEKYFAVSFRSRTVETPVAIRSPGHQLVRNTQLSDIDLTEMMVDWTTRGVDKWNYDPREAVCSWVAQNFDGGLNLKYFLPEGYPRVIIDKAGYNTPLLYFSGAFAALGVVTAAVVGGVTYRFRGEKQIKFAQEFFLYLFSLGFVLVCIGSVLYCTVPSAGTCAARWWFVVIGFTFVFVPLLIKIAAINKLMNDARKMRRTNVSKQMVYKVVAGLVFLVVIYLSIWTGIDAPLPQEELVLREEHGKYVDVHIQCSTSNMAWQAIAFGWEGILICSAAAVAFISRKIRQAFNESKVVGNVAYSSFFFFVFRLLIFFLPDSILQPSLKNAITSLLLTCESMVVMGMYFGTKFYSIYKHQDDQERGGNSSIKTSALFQSKSNNELCPLCERPMPVEETEAPGNKSANEAVLAAVAVTKLEENKMKMKNQTESTVEAAVVMSRVSDSSMGETAIARFGGEEEVTSGAGNICVPNEDANVLTANASEDYYSAIEEGSKGSDHSS